MQLGPVLGDRVLAALDSRTLTTSRASQLARGRRPSRPAVTCTEQARWMQVRWPDMGAGTQLGSALGDRMLAELDSRTLACDALERALSLESDNGRLLRLLIRLASVYDHPRPDLSPEWSDTGAPCTKPHLACACVSSVPAAPADQAGQRLRSPVCMGLSVHAWMACLLHLCLLLGRWPACVTAPARPLCRGL